MANTLFSLFDERLKKPGDLVASPLQSLESLSSSPEDQEFILKKIRQLEVVKPLVDYSDFSNFVFFNSALDYFNVTGEKILNEYPYDGTRDDLQRYLDDLDDYQNFVVDNWPKFSGHLRFNPAISSSYVVVNDLGVEGGIAKTAMLSPTTGSFTIEMWAIPPPALTGSNDIMVAFQKVTGSGDGYTVYFSGSNVYFRVVSGSTTSEISAAASPGTISYFSFVADRPAAYSTIFTGSAAQFPVPASSAALGIAGAMNLGASSLTMGSGTLSSKVTRPLSGSLDNIRFWNKARTQADFSSSFNAKIYAQKNLVALWRFNESGSIGLGDPDNSIVSDASGHRLNGIIRNYHLSERGSGSLIPFEAPDLILSYKSPEVLALIADKQSSGSIYDKQNSNMITNMIPDEFFQAEQLQGTDVLEKFVYILARNFDYIKVRIDQFVHVLRTSYGKFDQTPDALLADVARFFGWEFTGNFLNANAFQYIVGKYVLANMDSNRELDKNLYQIKNEFWRRMLNNLMHVYKTKGTRESIESLLRVYGVNKNFVRLKEYGLKPNVGISTNRIHADKTTYAIAFQTGSVSCDIRTLNLFTSTGRCVETRVRFPITGSDPGMDPNLSNTTGSIWMMYAPGSGRKRVLKYAKTATTSNTGSLILSCSDYPGITVSNIPIFDNQWYNVSVNIDPIVSASMQIDIRRLDTDSIGYYVTSSVSLPGAFTGSDSFHLYGGYGFNPAGVDLFGQSWQQEMRVWEQPLKKSEMDDHALNYQSYGVDDVSRNSNLTLHWRLNENLTASAGGSVTTILDYSGNGNVGFGALFNPGPAYKKFLNDYNYIASPDMGWNEEKIRSFPSSNVKSADSFSEDPNVALEFNLMDALNEDISQMLSSLAGFDTIIGAPANAYRSNYQDLEYIRHVYFKRLQGRLNFSVFADMLEFFDRSFMTMVQRLIPARARFLGEEFVVESHMLERPKLQWNYHRQQRSLDLEGVIKVYLRT